MIQVRDCSEAREIAFLPCPVTPAWSSPLWPDGASAAFVVVVAAIAAAVHYSWHGQWMCVTLTLLFLTVGWVLRLCYANQPASESIVVYWGVGVVLEARSACGRVLSSSFLDKAHIRGVLLSEYLTTTDVRYHLSFITQLEPGRPSSLTLVFPALRPRLAELIPVYRELLAAQARFCSPAGSSLM